MSRTKEQVHEANNAVIAIAKDAAKRYGVHLVVAVVGSYDKAGAGLLVGVDASNECSWPLALYLSSITAGSLAAIEVGLAAEERQELMMDAAKSGAECAKSLWDRNVIEIQGERAAPTAPGKPDDTEPTQ